MINSMLSEKIIKIICSYCSDSQTTLADLCLLNQTFYGIALPHLLHSPKFGFRGMGGMQSFHKFIAILSWNSSSSRLGPLVKKLVLTNVKDSFYEAVPDHWLSTVLIHCTNLHTLDLFATEWITSSHIQSALSTDLLHGLHTLILSKSNLSAPLATNLVAFFHQLRKLSVSGISINDGFVEHVLRTCPFLEELDISDTCVTSSGIGLLLGSMSSKAHSSYDSTGDWKGSMSKSIDKLPPPKYEDQVPEAAYAQYLHTLNVSGCHGVTDSSSYGDTWSFCQSPLHFLIAANCPRLTDAFLVSLCGSLSQTLTKLDVSGCTGISWSHETVSQFCRTFGRTLTWLGVSFPSLEQHFNRHVFHFTSLVHINLTEISESSSGEKLLQLCASLPVLTSVRLIRKAYTSDYIVSSMYTTVESTKHSNLIDDGFVTKFHASQHKVVMTLVADEKEWATSISSSSYFLS